MRANTGGTSTILFIVLGMASADAQVNDVALPAIETADYDSQARFRVNGRPLFPILLYGAPTDDKSLAQLREYGFNTLACRPEECEALRAQGFYAAVHGARKPIGTASVLLAIGADSPALYFKKNLLEQVAEANAKATAGAPDRPVMNAIGYWEDEPAGVVAGKLPSKETYDDLVAAIEVAAPYLYPVPYQPVATVGDAVARARRATSGKKPVLPILQLFSWEPGARYPTPAELRCMTFLALVEGASGVGYYSYGTVTGPKKTTIAEVEPELWQSVKPLNREIAEIGPLLLDGEEAPSLALEGGGPAVRFKAAGRNRGFPAVLVNSTATAQKAKLVGQAGETAGRLHLGDGRKIEFQNAAVTLRWNLSKS